LQSKNQISLYDEVHRINYPLNGLYELVEKSASANPANVEYLRGMLSNSDPAFRFWATSGFATLYSNGYKGDFPDALKKLIDDEVQSVAATAAEALVYSGSEKKGIDALLNMFFNGSQPAASSLEEIQQVCRFTDEQKGRLEEAFRLKGEGSFQLRSLLINEGIIPMDSLFTQMQKDKFFKGYLNRISEWAPSKPNY
jgi:N-sulfoglucosamine sulfohydrolase